MPQTLTYADFITRAKAAIAENKLAVQHPEQLQSFAKKVRSDTIFHDGPTVCMNRYPMDAFGGKSCHCIIGSALDETTYYGEEGASITSLEGEGRLMVESPDEFQEMCRLQTFHDQVVGSASHETPEDFKRHCRDFVQSILELPNVFRA